MTKVSQWQDLASRIKELGIPSLVVTGHDDWIAPAESSICLAEELPAAHPVVMPECGHVPHEECAWPFLEAVTAFVKGLSR